MAKKTTAKRGMSAGVFMAGFSSAGSWKSEPKDTECLLCSGSGYTHTDTVTSMCPHCKGTGRVTVGGDQTPSKVPSERDTVECPVLLDWETVLS